MASFQGRALGVGRRAARHVSARIVLLVVLCIEGGRGDADHSVHPRPAAVAAAAAAAAPDAQLLSGEEDLFLRGCAAAGNVRACTAEKHARLLAYRAQHPEVYTNLTSGGIDAMIGSGAVMLDGLTCSGGHVVMVVRNRLVDWSRSSLELLQWQVYVHEALFHYAPASERGIIVVQDVSQFGLAQMWQVARSGGLGLLDYFDQNIAGIVLLGEPWFFASFWKVVRMLVPEKERNMVRMLGHKWDQLPHAVQLGAPQCKAWGPVENSLLKLPSDDDLGGIRLGSLPLEIPALEHLQQPRATEL